VPTYIMSLFGKYLTYALLALALDLVWGYCGILSLGHGAFFALGGYAMGMYLMRQIGARGVYGNPILPDFMVFLNYKELPWFWYGFDHFWFAALMVLVVPGLLAFVFGWFAFRSRVTGVYLSIITQAMTYALLLAFFRNDMGFGGNNGLTDFKDILGFNVQADGTRAACLPRQRSRWRSLCFASRHRQSKYGKVLVGVRDAESRTRFLGYRVENVKLFTFVVSAMMAGVAGALYVPQVGIINPRRVRSGQLDRSRHLDGGRRPRHADRADHRRAILVNGGKSSSPASSRILAVCTRRPVRRRDAVPAQGHRRHARPVSCRQAQAGLRDAEEAEASAASRKMATPTLVRKTQAAE
jgi:urea ABC transporter permease protein UrtC